MYRDDVLRALDPAEFAKSVGVTPDLWQSEVLRSEDKRILLNCCRQSGKSTTCSLKALHVALYKPKSLILLVSPSMRQSQELFKKCKDQYLAMDDRPPLTEDNKLSMTLTNGSRIISLPGDQATVRGYSSVTMILEDEAAQVRDEFYQAVLPMLIINNGTLVCMSTPLCERGRFYEEWAAGGPEWKKIEITAEMCPRITEEQLEAQRRSMGELFFEQEFMCRFIELEDTSFKYDLIQRAFSDDVLPLFQ